MSVTPEAVREAAVELIRPEFVDEWLAARNKMLSGRSPDELIADDAGQQVLDLIDFMCSGNFA
jgi:uncharacterized protein (DUF2384 family)